MEEGYFLEDQRTHFFQCQNIIVDPKGHYASDLKGMPLYLIMLIYSKSNNLGFLPSFRSIQKDTGFSIPSLISALKVLESLKLVRVSRKQGYKNRITILQVKDYLNTSKYETEEDKLIKHIAKAYNAFTPKTQARIKNYILHDTPLDSKMPEQLRQTIEKDKKNLKFKLALVD